MPNLNEFIKEVSAQFDNQWSDAADPTPNRKARIKALLVSSLRQAAAEGGKEMLEKMWQYAHDWATMIEKYGGINLKEWEGEDEIAASIMSYMRGEHLSSENKPTK